MIVCLTADLPKSIPVKLVVIESSFSEGPWILVTVASVAIHGVHFNAYDNGLRRKNGFWAISLNVYLASINPIEAISQCRRWHHPKVERTRIAERHACVTDRVVMHVFSCPPRQDRSPPGYVTASELEHPASQWRDLPSPGIAARSEPSRYKGVKAMHVFAHREKAGTQCVSFPLRSACSFRYCIGRQGGQIRQGVIKGVKSICRFQEGGNGGPRRTGWPGHTGPRRAGTGRSGDGTAFESVAQGYPTTDACRTEDALDPMRGRSDFRLLIMDLDMPDDPFARAERGPDRGQAQTVREPPSLNDLVWHIRPACQ